MHGSMHGRCTDIGDVKVGDEAILLGEEGNLKFNADDIAGSEGSSSDVWMSLSFGSGKRCL